MSGCPCANPKCVAHPSHQGHCTYAAPPPKPTTTETRIRLDRTEEPPDGYTFGHTDFDTETGKLWALWVNPAWPESTAHVWIEMRKVTQSRTVTGWEDVT